MSARQKLIITETEPTPIVKDFMTFAAYAEKNEILLTKTQGWLPRKALQSINALMTVPEPEVTAYSDQNAYPLLTLFHHLALAAKLFRTAPHPSGKQRLLPTERLPLFFSLNPTEKYISLLEAFWVDADWSAMTMNNYCNGPSTEVRMVFECLGNFPPGNTIDVSNKQLANLLWRWGYLVHYFRYFGFWETTKDKEASMKFPSKFAYPLKTLTPSPLFYTLCMELHRSRDLEIWNLSLRREAGDWRGVPGEPLWEDEDELVEEDFAQSLVHLFPAGELTQWLPRQTGEFFEGTYILQVAVRRNCWRRIRISSHSTLYDLHRAIQQAFDFDDDHLYAFFLDGKRWSTKRAFYSPDADERPVVTEACLGELELSAGQTFLYLFDFGDEWEFVVTVEDAGPIDTRQMQPQVIESKGAAPEQYRDYY